jgi:hypothetical protein
MLYLNSVIKNLGHLFTSIHASEENSLRLHNYLLLSIIFLLAACAGNKDLRDKNSETEYVEINNPGFTMTRDAPATIWVPKSSVDNGLPRGNEAIKMAYESVKGSQSADTSSQKHSPATGELAVVAVAPQRVFSGMRNRVAVLETSQQHLAILFQDKLRAQPESPVLSIAPEVSGVSIHSREERSGYAVKAWKEFGVNMTLFVSAPEGLASGKDLSVEIYDGMGAGLLSKIDAVIPANETKDPAGLNSAVSSSISLLAERARGMIALLPWHAKIVAVEDGKIYLNAGHEAGINLGQRLHLYRGGKVVQGLGFDPGTRVGTLEVSGFVGSNGAIAVVKDGTQVYLTDIVAAH